MAEPFHKLYFLFDRDHGPRDRLLPRWLFLRGLGLVYLSAFVALTFQILGMSGSGGILPAANYLHALRELGNQRFWLAPTVLWWSSSDHALRLLAGVGLVASALVVLNLAPRLALVVCWVCFLSWVAVSQDFGRYQSDGMLLEAGLLALFVAPAGGRPRWGEHSLASRAALFLLLWEWFRIYFESGIVKLASGDPTWRNLTAMYEYYQNGPLPTWVGWYLQHLPFWFHRATAGLTLLMELVLVFGAFLPRRWRLGCFVVVTLWQVGVIATANYAFLNYLVLILGFLLLDDRALVRFVPRRLRAGLDTGSKRTLAHEPERSTSAPGVPGAPLPEPAIPVGDSSLESAEFRRRRTGRGPAGRSHRHPRELVRALRIALTAVLLSTIGYATTVLLVDLLVPRNPLPSSPVTLLEPFRVANQYGLFATMTPHRYEIEFQGSADGQTWKPYVFRFKPQFLSDRPRIYAPYQPRFDWNLWFASLTTWDAAPIVPRTEIRLLEGSPETLSLFRGSAFPGTPPRYVRAVLYQYWFSTPAEKRIQDVWWTRRLLGTYAPTLTRIASGQIVAVAMPSLRGTPDTVAGPEDKP